MTWALLAVSLVGLAIVRLARRHPVIEFAGSVVTVAPMLALMVLAAIR